MAIDGDIQVDDLTTAEVEGRGVFDELMRATKDHMEQEYTKGRITGANYSNVYLGGLNQVLQVATQFVLQKGINSQQILLLEEQIAAAEQDTLLKTAQIALINKQIEQITGEIAFTAQKLLTEVQNTALVTQNTANAVSQNVVITNQGEKLVVDKSLVQENIYNAQAQRLETVDSVAVAGVLGKQKNLYQAQIDGFERDAEQKLTKILLDTWSVSRTTNDAVEVPDLANNTSIDQVLTVARTGIGLS